MNHDYATLEMLEVGMNSGMSIEEIILPENPQVNETYGPFFSADEFRKLEGHVFSREYTKDIIFDRGKEKTYYRFPNGGSMIFSSKTRTIVSRNVPVEILLRMGLAK
jgi:hypothetical protein